jgi:hypothetical protein
MGRDDRKEQAQWMADQFISYGYTDVVLDSFLCYPNWPGILVDTLWQYNVVARLEGTSAPDEVYVIGGHHDSFSWEDHYHDAPGADDNGSAVVVALETARVMKLTGYQPQATIEFTLWAAEELGLFGSKYSAARATLENKDIRYVLNLDMVANNPDSIPQVVVGQYEPYLWAADVSAQAYSTYTALEPIIPLNLNPSGSDSYSYYLLGFPTIFVQEISFSPHWHHISDTVGNCNLEYLTEVARGACATLMEQQNLPCPGYLSAHSGTGGIQLEWQPTANANVTGCNIYRSATSGSGYVKINQEPVPGPVYTDVTAAPGTPYYYVVTRMNALSESFFSPEAAGAVYAFSDTLLVMNTLKLQEVSPDSIRQFYEAILDTIPFRWYDLNQNQSFGLTQLSGYKNILWTANSTDYDQFFAPPYNWLKDFFDNGGNMMIAGFNPLKMLGNGTSYPFVPADTGSVLRDFFKADTVNRKVSSMMYRAYPWNGGYDTLRGDTSKFLTAGYPGEIFNVEVYAPAAGGNVIYRFDSHFPPNSPLGMMQDKPVGLEYMGDDFRTILLGFPLYYIDTADAKALMKYVMTHKFTHPTAVPPLFKEPGLQLKAFPNPFNSELNVTVSNTGQAEVSLFVVNMLGVRIESLFSGRLEAGSHTFRFDAGHLPSGLYHVVLSSGNGILSRKVVHIQ